MKRDIQKEIDIFTRAIDGETFQSIADSYSVSTTRIRAYFQKIKRTLLHKSYNKENEDVSHNPLGIEGMRKNKDWWKRRLNEWIQQTSI